MEEDPGVPALLSMLFLFALTSGASLTIAAITFKEMLSKEIVGTLMGCGNLVMIGASIEQDVTAAVVAKYEDDAGNVPLIAYRYGFWLLSAVSCGVSIGLVLVIKDTYLKAVEAEEREKDAGVRSLDVQMVTGGEDGCTWRIKGFMCVCVFFKWNVAFFFFFFFFEDWGTILID
jgi:hypothetical protein